MKLRIFSDVHNEFRRGKEWYPPEMNTDADTVLVLAGDVDVGKHLKTYIDTVADRFLAVVYVLGNHEMYKGNIDTIYEKSVSDAPNAHLLQNNTVTIGEVEFVGTTLWTDMAREDPFAVWNVRRTMSDFSQIREGDNYTKFTPARWLFENREAKRFLKETITPDKKQVVITHHAPDFTCAEGSPHGINNSSVYFYNNDLQDQIIDADLWIFGHTHHCYDQNIADTRVISNQFGYYGYEHVEKFDDKKLVIV